ncbi:MULTISPECIES: glycosyltransferase [Enterococcus]|uniref:glycosyltransferase n=1 Tax=Enterococcus TaxID=1350 RepID=UPI000E1B6818|nr:MULTISPECIES: glycosyltransferase [Enterococcus]EGP4964741.1 glycosyltransferase family 4 protein [Enterococcus faecium]EGP5223870.1 glycosyltransferase family 4 protein [Enterococcus faecium]EGP5499449.1 glycosyltransferase family 4 protein [Enterococcus faecium]MBT9708721.1 glycosyltransferase [Enterococcus faecium]MDU5303912.1 glycosyltransferase [Enterococcus faecium]
MGGASIVASKIAKGLIDSGHEVFFVSYLESEKPQVESKYYDLYEKKFFLFKNFSRFHKILEYRLFGGFVPSRYIKKEKEQLKKVLKKEKPDVVIFNTFIPSVLFSEFLKYEFPTVKLITWMHSDPDYSLNHIAKFYKKEYRKSFERVDSIVCLSQDTKEKLSLYNNHIKVIYNPLTLSGSNLISNLDKKIISFTARYDINIKGFDYLCEVAKNLPVGWAVRIAGDGTEEERKELKRLIEKNGVLDKIICAGALFGDELINHYIESSIFISTSRSEGLPLVLIEAMTYGLPVISFAHGGAKEILQDGNYGILIKNFDVQDMNNEIEKLSNNRLLMEKYQKFSLERAKDFNEKKIIGEWQTLLNELGNEDVRN